MTLFRELMDRVHFPTAEEAYRIEILCQLIEELYQSSEENTPAKHCICDYLTEIQIAHHKENIGSQCGSCGKRFQ